MSGKDLYILTNNGLLNEEIGIKNNTKPLPPSLLYQMILWSTVSPELLSLSPSAEEPRLLLLGFILLESL